jgi:hypothetical protein
MRRILERFAWTRQPALLALAVVSVSVGCQSAPKSNGPTVAQLRTAEFQRQLALSTTAINDGDLSLARQHLVMAREAACSTTQENKADSLQFFIDGAQAFMEGDLDGTETAWARINDPALRGEVDVKATRLGINGLEATP